MKLFAIAFATLISLAGVCAEAQKCVVTYTFDDGLADQYTIAYPMFRKAGLPATFFIIGSKIGDSRGMRSKAERNTPVMTWEQIRDMSTNGMEIASHGWAHAKYAKMSRDEILDDIRRNQVALKENAGVDCVSFASPFNAKKGADGSDIEALAKETGILAVRMKQKGAGGKMTAERMNSLVESAKRKGEWLVFMIHGMSRGYDAWESPQELERHLAWVKEQKDVEVLSFAAAAKRVGTHAMSTAEAIAAYEGTAEAARDPLEKEVEAPKDMKLVLLVGQSNMSGRAPVTKEFKKPIERCYKLNRDGKWALATNPFHFDRKYCGVGPADEFARRYLADHPGETIGLVPCAVGGSPLSSWVPAKNGRKGENFRRALERTKIAQTNGKIIAILWHQGETDAAKASAEQLMEYYPKGFADTVAAFRLKLGLDAKVPVIVGEIGRWMRKDGDHAAKVNPAIHECANRVVNCACVSAEGLKNQDPHHFDAPSVKTLGTRYYEAWKGISK